MIAQGAWIYLIFVKDAFIFVSHYTEKFIVHGSLLKAGHKVFLLHKVNDSIAQGFDIKFVEFPLNKIKWNNFRFLVLAYLHFLYDCSVEFRVGLLVAKAIVAFKNHAEVSRHASPAVYLIWMWYFSLHILSQFDQCFARKILEKSYVVKENFVRLNPVLWLDTFGQWSYDLIFLIKCKELLNLERFFDKICNLTIKLIGNLILFRHSMKDLETFALFRITGLKLTNQRTDITDVVGKGNAAESFNKN